MASVRAGRARTRGGEADALRRLGAGSPVPHVPMEGYVRIGCWLRVRLCRPPCSH